MKFKLDKSCTKLYNIVDGSQNPLLNEGGPRS